MAEAGEDLPEGQSPDEERLGIAKKVLSCPLSRDERAKIDESIHALMDVDISFRRERRRIIKLMNARITHITAQIQSLHEQWKSRSKQQAVDCEVVRDNRRHLLITRRLDTGDIIEQRALTAEERQGNLGFDRPEAPAELDADETVERFTKEQRDAAARAEQLLQLVNFDTIVDDLTRLAQEIDDDDADDPDEDEPPRPRPPKKGKAGKGKKTGKAAKAAAEEAG